MLNFTLSHGGADDVFQAPKLRKLKHKLQGPAFGIQDHSHQFHYKRAVAHWRKQRLHLHLHAFELSVMIRAAKFDAVKLKIVQHKRGLQPDKEENSTACTSP
jgi:hypothetical protein